jgi:hypothetical protein
MSATFIMLTRQGCRALVLAPRHAIKCFCVLEADRQLFVQPWWWLVFIGLLCAEQQHSHGDNETKHSHGKNGAIFFA